MKLSPDEYISKCIHKSEKSNNNLNKKFVLNETTKSTYTEWGKLASNSQYVKFSSRNKNPAPYRHFREYDHINIVHMVRYDPKSGSPVYKDDFEKLIRNWDVVSCSVFDAKKNGYKGSGTLSSVGFLLSVPPQNILGAHPTDVWFPNHAGARPEQEYLDASGKSSEPPDVRARRAGLLSKALMHDITLLGPVEKLGRGVTSLTDISPPKNLAATDKGYSEVLVAGKPHVNIYQGKPATRRIKVNAILINADYREFKHFHADYGWGPHRKERERILGPGVKWTEQLAAKYYFRWCWRKASALRQANPHLSILVTRTGMAGLNWNWRDLKDVRPGDGFLENQVENVSTREDKREASATKLSLSPHQSQVARSANTTEAGNSLASPNPSSSSSGFGSLTDGAPPHSSAKHKPTKETDV